MRQRQGTWYLVGLLVAAVPVGVRVLTWAWPWAPRLEPDAVAAGQVLFTHEWTSPDPLAPGGDGLGPVYNATSCAECHRDGGVGGSGGLAHNVTTFTVRPGRFSRVVQRARAREGLVHAFAVRFPETLHDVDPSLPATSRPDLGMLVPMATNNNRPMLELPAGVHVSQRNTPALFGARLIDAIPDREVIAAERFERIRWGMAPADGEDRPVGRAVRLAGGRVGKFGWKAQSASLADFVQAACANELGLGNPGQAQPRPLSRPVYQPPGLDLTAEQCEQLTAFVGSLPRPVERPPSDPAERDRAEAGKALFGKIGCADCHVPSLAGVDGIYSDLLVHRMGEALVGGGSYNEPTPGMPGGPPPPSEEDHSPSEWRTPPLWGVADTAPYLHDGRARTLAEAVVLHGGQAAPAARRFGELGRDGQGQLIALLQTLRAP